MRSCLLTTERSAGFTPPYLGYLEVPSSPYINRFLSADTIVPGYANPQNLNRYSYVLNNPLRYTDPTGHMMVEDEGSTKGGLNCSKYPQYCNNGKKKSDKELRAMSPKVTTKNQQPNNNLLTQAFNNHELLESWDTTNIEPADFDELLGAIGVDVHRRSKSWLFFAAVNYDTPFFNGYGLLSGTGCINGKCYDRSELNYVGEGEVWAALGVSKSEGHMIVTAWKHKGCAEIGFHGETLCLNPAAYNQPTEGVIEMFDTGYDYYNQYFPSSP
jgi:hypothetical protein